MITRVELTNFLYETFGSDLLNKAALKDSLPNGVQIHGKEEVEKIVLGVSASLGFIQQAIQHKADYLIAHHGLHINGLVVNGRLEPVESRLRMLFNFNVTLAGFHYALDAEPRIGNNAQIIKAVGAKNTGEPFFDEWGYVGEFSEAVDYHKFSKQCAKLFKNQLFAVKSGPDKIKRIGVCSGGAKPRGREFFEILDKQIDLFISGEISESGPHTAEEGGYNYFACGHYATEVFGVKALAKEIKGKFGDKVVVDFLDIPSPL